MRPDRDYLSGIKVTTLEKLLLPPPAPVAPSGLPEQRY